MRTRKNRIAVRITEEQFNKINSLTERSFFSKESILRCIVLGYPIQEKPAKEYTELFVVLRKLGSVIGNLNYRYGLRRYPIGEEIDQTARLIRKTEKALSESNFVYYKKPRKRRKTNG